MAVVVGCKRAVGGDDDAMTREELNVLISAFKVASDPQKPHNAPDPWYRYVGMEFDTECSSICSCQLETTEGGQMMREERDQRRFCNNSPPTSSFLFTRS